MTDKNVLSYYDTQVLPYQNYFYKIFAHKAVLASRYKPIKYDEDQFVNFFQDPTPLSPESPRRAVWGSPKLKNTKQKNNIKIKS